jgi:hypothetical protein
MRKVLEMQRNTKLPDGMGAIGGFAEIVTISADGIYQRVVQRWGADQVGAPLKPDPIDWAKWHSDNPKPVRATPILRVVA